MTTPAGGGELDGLLAQMSQLQEELAAAEARSDAQQVEGSAGGGAVRVAASGDFEFTKVSIDPALCSAENAELLEDLVLAAVRDAASRLAAARRAALDDVMRGALGGLLGGQPDADDQDE